MSLQPILSGNGERYMGFLPGAPRTDSVADVAAKPTLAHSIDLPWELGRSFCFGRVA